MRRAEFMKKTGCILLTLAMGASFAAGCGNTSETDSTASGDEASVSAGSEAGTSSSAVETIRVATGQAWAPYCYRDENGDLTGYDVEVLQAVDEKLEDYELDIQGMDFSTCIVSVDSGAVDMVSYQLVQSDERKEKYIFPDLSYCYSPLGLAVKSDSGITNLEDMAGKKIYSDPSTFEYGLLTEYNEAHPDAQFEIVAVSDMAQADSYKGVSNGTVDASLTYQTAFDTTIPEIGVDNLILTDAVIVEESYYMINKDKTEFRDAVSEALQEMMDDGTLGELSTKWFGEDYFTKYADLINYDLEEE